MIDFTKPVRTKVDLSLPRGSRLNDDDIYFYFENIPQPKSNNNEVILGDLGKEPALLKMLNKNSRLDALKDPKEAMAYLEAALEEAQGDDFVPTLGSSSGMSRFAILADAINNVIEANKEQEQYVWINVYKYPDRDSCFVREIHASKTLAISADNGTGINPVGRLKIKLEKGRFDE